MHCPYPSARLRFTDTRARARAQTAAAFDRISETRLKIRRREISCRLMGIARCRRRFLIEAKVQFWKFGENFRDFFCIPAESSAERVPCNLAIRSEFRVTREQRESVHLRKCAITSETFKTSRDNRASPQVFHARTRACVQRHSNYADIVPTTRKLTRIRGYQ